MQRPQLLALLIVLGLAAAAVLWLAGGFSAPPPLQVEPAKAPAVEVVDAAAARAAPTSTRTDDAKLRREVTVPQHFDVADDPDIRAAMTGFRGRVVDRTKQPVADCGVRLYRGAMDTILPEGVDPMAEEPTWTPNYVAGETKTGEDGKFLIDQVWPRAFYMLLAGIGTDAPSHRLLQHSPEPGEIVDLGDIQLDPCGVVIGTVVDEDGEPVADALVRAVDLPGQIVSLVPVERFDPKGCVLVREKMSPIQVVEMPGWVATAFEHLPIPATRSDATGKFRLVGVMPGNNYIATTRAGLQADVKPTVKVESAETKDLGTIRLRQGEDLAGRVVDSAGKPVVAAEVVAGSVSGMAPFDFASHVGVTDADGRFEATGFMAGKVSVAVRRSARDPWVLADPQPILNDVVVTLPGIASLTVRVMFQGEVVREPSLRLMPSKQREEAMVMAVVGFQKSVDLRQRRSATEDGHIVLADLPNARYVLLAQSEGAAVSATEVDLSNGPAQIQVELQPSKGFVVRVLGPEDAAIRNAAVYVQDRNDRGGGMPVRAGRTGTDGRLRVDQVAGTNVRISAEHPRWGQVHGKPEPGQFDGGNGELVLRMLSPGWIEGTVTDGGKPPAIGKYSVAVERRSNGARGAIEGVPALATPALDGQFSMRAMQPGTYRVGVFPSAEAVHSPGGVMELMQGMFNAGHESSQEVEVVSGQAAIVAIDASGSNYSGPVGSVFGTVQVDGRLAAGYRVHAWANGTRRSAIVDDSGRFDLSGLPAGSVYLSLVSADSGMFDRQGMWSRSIELKEAELKEISIILETTALRGEVIRPDGSPAVGVHVQARGRPLDGKEDNSNGWWHNATTDAEGRFRFDTLSAGVYDLAVNGNDNSAMRGELKNVRAAGGLPVEALRLQLRGTVEFSGRVDVSMFAVAPDWIWMTIHTVDPKDPDNAFAGQQIEGIGIGKDGKFSTHGLDAGTYRVVVHANVGQEWETMPVPQAVTVMAGGSRDVLLQPQLQPRQKR